jgi:hypothetical protein
MEQSRVPTVVLAFAAMAAACVPVNAQAERDAPTPQPTEVREVATHPMPFATGIEHSERVAALEFRSYDQMTPQDRELAAEAQSSIGERAGYAGLEFNQGKWNFQQIVCSALPSHLFLQFTRNEGAGSMSEFSASIPRGNNGRVRIIPILRRGYTLFSPAPSNALTVSVFNQIRAEEHPDKAPEWLATGLCYAALAGARPQTELPEASEIQKLPAVSPGMLATPVHGGAIIRFTDVAAAPQPMEWTMTFDGKGTLLKAACSAAPGSKDEVVALNAVEAHGKPIQTTDLNGKARTLK